MKARGTERAILFCLPVQVHAYLKAGLGTPCCVVLRRASWNNGFVHWTSLRSLICFVIRSELQPTRLRLGSRPPLAFLPTNTKTRRKQRATLCHNKGIRCRPSLLEVFLCESESAEDDGTQTAAAQRADCGLIFHRAELCVRPRVRTHTHAVTEYPPLTLVCSVFVWSD